MAEIVTSRRKSRDSIHDDRAAAGARDFADADLPEPLLGGISRQPEQAETGDEDGQRRENGEDPSDRLLRFVLIRHALVKKGIMKRSVRNELVPGPLNRRQDVRKLIAFYPDGGQETDIAEFSDVGKI